MNCSKCGKQLFPNEMICSSCGHNNMSYENNMNNNMVVNNNLSQLNNQNISNEVPVNLDNNINTNQVFNTNNMVNEQSVNNNVEINTDTNIDNNTNNVSSNNKKGNKKTLFLVLALVGILLMIGIILLIVNPFRKNEDKKQLVEKSYTMYVKINPLVKLNIKEKYYECTDGDTGSVEVCSEITDEVVTYNFINNDAKEIYDNLDLKEKTVVDALVALYDTARENNIEFTNIEITTNWDNRYTNSELVNSIKEKTKYTEQFSVIVDVKSGEITTTQILKKYGIDENVEITYTVIFNSDGGSSVEEQEVKEKEKVTKPSDPTRDGYNFVEWQLDGVKYDFDLEVKSDIELKAKWEQIVVKEEKPKEEETPKEEEKPPVTPPEGDGDEIGAPTTPPEEETKQESTLDKINLNDNIYVEIHEGINSEGITMGYIITTNAEEVFGDDIFVADNGQKMVYSTIDGFDEKYNQLEFNDMLESSTLALTERMGSNLPAGVSSFTCSKNERRMINCRTKYLNIYYDMQEQFAILTEQLNNSLNIVFNYPTQAFSSVAVYVSPGGMGTGPGDPILLTEELCNEYNLTCDRW